MNETPTPAPDLPPGAPPNMGHPGTVATAPAGTLQLMPPQPAPLPDRMVVLNVKVRAVTVEEARKILAKLPPHVGDDSENNSVWYEWGDVSWTKTTEPR